MHDHVDSKPSGATRAIELLEQVKMADPSGCCALPPRDLRRNGPTHQHRHRARRPAAAARWPTNRPPPWTSPCRREILQLLRDLQQSTEMAILLITHDWGVVADIADRAVVMYAGEVVERADVQTLFTHPRFPYTAALLAAEPSLAAEKVRACRPCRAGSRRPGSWPTRMPVRQPVRLRP